MNDPERTESRRRFLQRLSVGALAAGSIIASGRAETAQARKSAATSRAHDLADDGACTDVSKLSAEQKKARQSLQYVNDSPHAEKRCNNCRLFEAPEDKVECGACQVVPGPIHPKGYCIAWAVVTS